MLVMLSSLPFPASVFSSSLCQILGFLCHVKIKKFYSSKKISVNRMLPVSKEHLFFIAQMYLFGPVYFFNLINMSSETQHNFIILPKTVPVIIC